MGKLIEPLWGALEMVTFFFIVNTGVAVLSAFFYYILYMSTFNTELLFDVHIHGLSGYLAGVSIAVKQVMPDHILARTPVGKITNRNIPLTVFGLTFIMWAIGMVEGSYCTMFGTGLIVSWVYLRFYQVRLMSCHYSGLVYSAYIGSFGHLYIEKKLGFEIKEICGIFDKMFKIQ